VEFIVQKLHHQIPVLQTLEYITDIANRPKCIAGATPASVTISTRSRVVLDSYSDCNAIGRFVLRSRGNTITVGFCDKIILKLGSDHGLSSRSWDRSMAYHFVAGIGPWPIISKLGSVHGLSSRSWDRSMAYHLEAGISPWPIIS